MNYFDIVLAGYANENTKKHLTNYFTREYKKAKNNHYTIEEFFDGCLSILNKIEKPISISKMNRLNELNTILNWKKKGMKGDVDKPKTPTQKDLNEAEEIKKVIDSLKLEHFPFNLSSLKPQKYTGLIYYSDLKYIKLHLITAKKQLIEPQLKMYDNLKKSIDDIEEKINEKFSNNSDQPISNEVLSETITHVKRTEIAKAIKDKYHNTFTSKDCKILYEALLTLDLFPPTRKRQLFFRCLKNEQYNINNHQMLEDHHFKKGVTNARGNYIKSDDEKQHDEIVTFLKGIIES